MISIKSNNLSQVQESVNMLPAPSRFFSMWQVSAVSDDPGFQCKLSKHAQGFLDKLFLAKPGDGREPEITLCQSDLQSALLDSFHEKNTAADLTNTAQSGLYLRCYVLEP
jgi:hypothetical protein